MNLLPSASMTAWECASKTAMFKAQTVGLVSAADFKRARVKAESASVSGGAEGNKTDKNDKDKQVQRESKKKKKKQIAAFMSLSFGEDMEEGVQTVNAVDNESAQKESGDGTKTASHISCGAARDPSTDTSFLPDRERDARVEAEKSRLRQEWMEEQEKIRKEELEVVYSYWDGSGHRRQIVTTKGTTIGKFLEMVRFELAKDFIEMKSVSSANLMYVIIVCSCFPPPSALLQFSTPTHTVIPNPCDPNIDSFFS